MESNSHLFIMLFVLNFCTFTTYGVALAFFPNIGKNHGLTPIETGFIFSFYPIGGVLIGVVLGKAMHYFKKKNLMYFFQFLLVVSVLTFGLASFVEDKFMFIFICIFSRFFQGLSAGAYETIAYSYVPLIWPNEMEKKLAILEISGGLGIGFGPVLGSFFYILFGYFSIFLIQSLYIYLIGLFIIYKYLSIIERRNEDLFEGETVSIKVFPVFKDKNMIFLCMILCFVFTGFTLIMTDFENHILQLGGSITLCSFLFLLGNIDYIISICFIEKMKMIYGRIALFNISLMSIVLSLFLMGIDLIFTFNNKLIIFIFIGLGMFIMGLGISIIVILFIPECIDLIKNIVSSNVNEEQKSDLACGIFTSVLSFAEFIGPLIGGILADKAGFSLGCYIYGVFLLFFTFFYIKFGNGIIGVFSLLHGKRETNNDNLRYGLIELDLY